MVCTCERNERKRPSLLLLLLLFMMMMMIVKSEKEKRGEKKTSFLLLLLVVVPFGQEWEEEEPGNRYRLAPFLASPFIPFSLSSLLSHTFTPHTHRHFYTHRQVVEAATDWYQKKKIVIDSLCVCMRVGSLHKYTHPKTRWVDKRESGFRSTWCEVMLTHSQVIIESDPEMIFAQRLPTILNLT